MREGGLLLEDGEEKKGKKDISPRYWPRYANSCARGRKKRRGAIFATRRKRNVQDSA